MLNPFCDIKLFFSENILLFFDIISILQVFRFAILFYRKNDIFCVIFKNFIQNQGFSITNATKKAQSLSTELNYHHGLMSFRDFTAIAFIKKESSFISLLSVSWFLVNFFSKCHLISYVYYHKLTSSFIW